MTQQQLSPMAQDYVKVVWSAGEWSTEPVTIKQLAERMEVALSTVSDNVRRLSEQGLLHHERYGAITLTDKGRELAVDMVRRHRLIETYLVERLGYTWDEVHDEAEVLEHACSDRMIGAMDAELGHPVRDPHGDPIPRSDGTIDTPPAVVLSQAEPGMWTVARISDADPELLRFLESLGLGLDVHVRVHPASPYVDGMRIDVSGVRTDVALGQAAADAVWVVKQGEVVPPTVGTL